MANPPIEPRAGPLVAEAGLREAFGFCVSFLQHYPKIALPAPQAMAALPP